MSTQTFLLIPGRTSRQGCGVSEGKQTEGYLSETTLLRIAPDDMALLGLSEGSRVRLTSAAGHVEVAIVPAKSGDLPPGMLFIAYGDVSSRLMGADTHGTGMPTSKGIDVTLESL